MRSGSIFRCEKGKVYYCRSPRVVVRYKQYNPNAEQRFPYRSQARYMNI